MVRRFRLFLNYPAVGELGGSIFHTQKSNGYTWSCVRIIYAFVFITVKLIIMPYMRLKIVNG